jgi:hypothetical protein
VLTKLPAADLVDDKEGKPVGIESRIGRRPIAAFGNPDGDLLMLHWTTAGGGPSKVGDKVDITVRQVPERAR